VPVLDLVLPGRTGFDEFADRREQAFDVLVARADADARAKGAGRNPEAASSGCAQKRPSRTPIFAPRWTLA
jgi:hypothetical protein